MWPPTPEHGPHAAQSGRVCVCGRGEEGAGGGSYRGPEEETEEKIKRGERGADEKRGENGIEGEGRKEKGWRVRRGEERSEGKSEEGESEAFTHSGWTRKLNHEKKKVRGRKRVLCV